MREARASGGGAGATECRHDLRRSDRDRLVGVLLLSSCEEILHFRWQRPLVRPTHPDAELRAEPELLREAVRDGEGGLLVDLRVTDHGGQPLRAEADDLALRLHQQSLGVSRDQPVVVRAADGQHRPPGGLRRAGLPHLDHVCGHAVVQDARRGGRRVGVRSLGRGLRRRGVRSRTLQVGVADRVRTARKRAADQEQEEKLHRYSALP